MFKGCFEKARVEKELMERKKSLTGKKEKAEEQGVVFPGLLL